MTGSTRILLAAVTGGTVLRLVVGATLGLGIDEQYVLAVAREFQWSFLDHPPLGFWLGTLAWQVGKSLGAGSAFHSCQAILLGEATQR